MQHLNFDHNDVPPVSLINPIGDGHNNEQHNDNEVANDNDDDDDDGDDSC